MSPNTIRNYRTTFAKLQAYFDSHPDRSCILMLEPVGDCLNVDISFPDEDGGHWFEGEARLSALAPLRDDTPSAWPATIARCTWPGCWPPRPTTAHAVRTTRSWSFRSRRD